MNHRRICLALLSCFGSLCVFPGSSRAQSVTTDPVGAITLTLKGASDTLVSLPFHRPVAVETQVQSLSINGSTHFDLTIAASANVTASEFVYAVGTQSNTYYLQFTTGNRQGYYYTITANSPTVLTVSLNGDTGFNSNVNPGDTFRVIPYWTLNTLFPAGQGTYTSTTGTPASEILVASTTTPGINLSASSIYFYNSGTSFPVGWYSTQGSAASDVTLAPDSSFIVRHPASTVDTQLVLVGNVPMSAQSIVLNNLSANTPQDNIIALPLPVSVTLGNSTLSSVMTPSTTGSTAGADELLVFDPTVAGQNKSATAIYFYYTGPGGPGWAQTNGNFPVDSSTIFQPGYGYILRRAAQPSAGSVVWTFTPPYLNQSN